MISYKMESRLRYLRRAVGLYGAMRIQKFCEFIYVKMGIVWEREVIYWW